MIVKGLKPREPEVSAFRIWAGLFTCDPAAAGGGSDFLTFTVARTHQEAFQTIEQFLIGLPEVEGTIPADRGALRPVDPKEWGMSPGQMSRLLRQIGYRFVVPVQYLSEDDIDELVHRCMTFKEKK